MGEKKRVKFTNKDKTQFLKTLKLRIDSYFTENNINPLANANMVTKTIALLGLYILPFVAIYLFSPQLSRLIKIIRIFYFDLNVATKLRKKK